MCFTNKPNDILYNMFGCHISVLFQVSYWRQFEHGILGRSAVRKLLELTETCADKFGRYITLDDNRASWKMKGVYRLFPKIVSAEMNEDDLFKI